MNNSIVFLLVILLLAFGCGRQADRLRSGDLIFVGLPLDYKAEPDSMAAAISSATSVEGALNLIHVAMAEVEADSVWIIDATIAHGVDRHPLDTFLADFTLRDGTMPPYWEWLFGKLGMAVPQGLPGTNPQRMAESALLYEVPVKLY